MQKTLKDLGVDESVEITVTDKVLPVESSLSLKIKFSAEEGSVDDGMDVDAK